MSIQLLARIPAQPGDPALHHQLEELQQVLGRVRSRLANSPFGGYIVPDWAVRGPQEVFTTAGERLAHAAKLGSELPDLAATRRFGEDVGQAQRHVADVLDRLSHAHAVPRSEYELRYDRWVYVDTHYVPSGVETLHQATGQAIQSVDDATRGVSHIAEYSKPVPASTRLTTAGWLAVAGGAALLVGASLYALSRLDD